MMNKKVSPEWLNVFLGFLAVFMGAWFLLRTGPDPKRDIIGICIEIVPFVILGLYGLMLVVRSVKRLRGANPESLDKTTEVFGSFSFIAIGIFLILPVFAILMLFLAMKFHV